MYCYIWEYEVRPDRVDAFERAYGPEGKWVSLFRRDPGYLRTVTLRGAADPTRFITIDFWQSAGACRAFRERYRKEFNGIDADCEMLTDREIHVGDFEVME